jgi:hypothetical protein
MVDRLLEGNDVYMELPIIVTSKNDLPALEVRRATSDLILIKMLVTCAIYDKPLIVLPTFKNKILSVNALIEKGILFRNKEDNKLYFLE